jgi:hypothetical protein
MLPTAPQDVMGDGFTCARDATLLAALGINTIITVGYNSFLDHSACMQAFGSSGIYVLPLLSYHIDGAYRVNQKIAFGVDYTLLERYIKMIDGLSVYPNLIGFMMDVNDHRYDEIGKLPVTKAFLRDVKEHIRRGGAREIPIGAYGNNPGKTTLIPDFFGCGDPQIAADFYAFDTPVYYANPEELLWCANSSMGYDRMAERYRGYKLPILVTYGCEANKSHTFQEVQYLYTGTGSEVFAGAIVDAWFPTNGIYIDNGMTRLDRMQPY